MSLVLEQMAHGLLQLGFTTTHSPIRPQPHWDCTIRDQVFLFSVFFKELLHKTKHVEDAIRNSKSQISVFNHLVNQNSNPSICQSNLGQSNSNSFLLCPFPIFLLQDAFRLYKEFPFFRAQGKPQFLSEYELTFLTVNNSGEVSVAVLEKRSQ